MLSLSSSHDVNNIFFCITEIVDRLATTMMTYWDHLFTRCCNHYVAPASAFNSN